MGLSEQLHSVLVEITNSIVTVTPSETECEDLLYWAECCRSPVELLLIWGLNADSLANYSSMKNQYVFSKESHSAWNNRNTLKH